MAQCFRAEGGIVVEVAPHDASDYTPGTFTDVPEGTTVAVGMSFDGKAFGPAPAPTPIPPRPRLASTYQLMAALTDAQRAAYPGPIKAWDQRYFGARDTPWPEDNPKIGRIAPALGTSPGAWFDAALNPPEAPLAA